MNNEEYKKSFVLQLFNLDEKDVQDVRYIPAGDNTVIDIKLLPSAEPCDVCGYDKPVVKNYVLKKINHSILTDRKCTLHYHARRYECPVCKKTYYEKNPFVFKSMKISAKTVYSILEDLKNYNETFSSVAKRYHVSPTSAASIFDSHVNMERKPLPAILNFDEVYAFKSTESKYVCVLLDFEKQTPVDVLPSRRYDYLLSYFMSIPLKERKNVQFVCSDMYDCYRSIAKACFPNCITLVDHYHVSADLNKRVDSVRTRVMKQARNSKDKSKYYLLKNFNWMIYTNDDEKFNPDSPKKFNRHFNHYMNFYDLREKILEISPELNEAWMLKDEVVRFYNECTSDNAKDELNKIIKRFKSSSVAEIVDFSKTLNKWKEEIVNSFYIVGHEYKVNAGTGYVAARQKKINNAIIENRNSIIKCLKKNANGYSNWTRFRNRILYVLDKNSTYSMYPIVKRKGDK